MAHIHGIVLISIAIRVRRSFDTVVCRIYNAVLIDIYAKLNDCAMRCISSCVINLRRIIKGRVAKLILEGIVVSTIIITIYQGNVLFHSWI